MVRGPLPLLRGVGSQRVLLRPSARTRQAAARCSGQNHRIWPAQARWLRLYGIVPDASKRTLQAIIRGKVGADSIIHTDGWRGYDGLVDMGFDKHFRINHGRNEFAKGTHHVNGIESFWSFAKRRLAKFNGIPRHTFALTPQRV